MEEPEPQTPRDYMLKMPDSNTSEMMPEPVPQHPYIGYVAAASFLMLHQNSLSACCSSCVVLHLIVRVSAFLKRVGRVQYWSLQARVSVHRNQR